MAERKANSTTLAILFDGDDTLWRTECLYDQARQKARAIVSRVGLNGAEWETLERQFDIENVASFGFSPERFPNSCVQAYETICSRAGRAADPAISLKVRDAARSVFQSTPRLVAGARRTLHRLRSRGVKLALLTKGDPEIQRRRVESSGLADLFDVIAIVPGKNPEVIRSVLRQLHVSPEAAWMVGNSIRSDILPALEAGLKAIWIDAHVWEYEKRLEQNPPPAMRAVLRLTDLTSALA